MTTAGRLHGGEEFLAQPRRAVGWGSALLALVALAAIFVPAGPLALDSRWAELMRDIETPFLTHVATIFNALGRGLWRALTIGAIGLALVLARRWAALIAFALVEAVTPLVGNAVKALVDRPRPPGPLLEAHGPSFPSGHSSYASATTIALVLLFTEAGRRRTAWFALAVAASAGMAWSRTYLNVHWLSDVLVGATLGLAVALISFGIVQLGDLARLEDHLEREHGDAHDQAGDHRQNE